MTVKEVIDFLMGLDKEGKVVVCDWEVSSAIRVFSEGKMSQLMWEEEEK